MNKLTPLCCALLLSAACGKKESQEAPPPAKADPAGAAQTASAPPAKAPPAAASVLTEKLLSAGDHVPDFSMVAHDGTTVSPKAIDGPLVVYFYPKDETPG